MRNKKLVFLLILAAGIILRLIRLDQSLWLDEAISALTAKSAFPFQWTGIAGDFQPPFYYLLLHFYMQIVPVWSEWILRIPSLVFGVLTVILIYKFSEKLFDSRVALFASSILATSQFHIYYSQELRMYSLLCLLASLSMWLFYEKKWLLFTVVSVIGFYTHYMFSLIIIPQLIWLIYKFKRDFIVWKKWIASIIIIVIFYLPWLPNLLKQWMNSKSLMGSLPLWKELSSLPFWRLPIQLFLKFTLGRIDFNSKYLYGFIFAALVTLYSYIIFHLRKKIDGKVLYILNWFLTPLIVSLLISFFVPISGVWRLIFLLVPFLILIAVSLRRSKYSSLLLMFILSINLGANLLYWKYPSYQRENWRGAVSFLNKSDKPLIFTVEKGFAPYQWYTRKDQQICGPSSIQQCLASNKVIYISYLSDLFDPNKDIVRKLNQHGMSIADVKNFDGVGFIYLYENSH